MPPKIYASLNYTESHGHAQFAVLDTRPSFGITFFVVRGYVVATHEHTPRAPHALETFRSLDPLYQPKALWIYVSLPEGEEVSGYGLRYLENEAELLRSCPTLIVRPPWPGQELFV
jgi:hypothetical protein